MSITSTPWILALITAIWFALMARRAQGNWVLWAIGGGLFALVTSTIIFGLGDAGSIPFSDHDRVVFHLKWTAISVVVIGVLGWLFTWGLHRHHQAQLPRESAGPASKS